MEKIVIIGPGGAGKTTLARKLGSILNINVVHLDRILWQCDWKEKPRDTRIDIIQNLVQEKQWIIDGTYLSTSELHLEAADTIILMDISPLVCLLRIIRRHQEYDGRFRRDIPMGSTDKLTIFLILKVLSFPFQGRRTIKQNLCTYKSKQIFWFRSPEEVEDLLVWLELHAGEQRQLSKTLTIARKRHLALSEKKTRIYQARQLFSRFKAHLNKAIKGILHDNIITPWANSDAQWHADVLRALRTRRAAVITAWVHRLEQ